MNATDKVNTSVCLPIFRRKKAYKPEDFLKIQAYILQQKTGYSNHSWVSTPDSSREAINPQIDISHLFITDPANPIEKRYAEKFKNTCIIQGFVTELVFNEKKPQEPSRILVSMPFVKNREDEDFKPLDSHIWLYVNKLEKESKPVFIGSFITIAATVNDYVKKNTGLDSKGIKEWVLLDSNFLYFARPKNTIILKKVPCSDVKTARCCIFQPDKQKPQFSKKKWAQEYEELNTEVLYWQILSQGYEFNKASLAECQII